MGADNNLTITAQAVDQMSGPMKAAAQSFADMAAKVANADQQIVSAGERVSQSHASLRSELRQTTREIHHAAAGVELLGGALGEGAGEFGKIGAHALGFAGVLATGGPLGIAIAAATAAVAAGVAIWEDYEASEKSVESAQRGLKGLFEEQAKSIAAQTKRVEEADKAIKNFGLTAAQAHLREIGDAAKIGEKGIAGLSHELEDLTAKIHGEQAAIGLLGGKTDYQWLEVAKTIAIGGPVGIALTQLRALRGELFQDAAADTREELAQSQAQVEGLERAKTAIEEENRLRAQEAEKVKQLTALEHVRDTARIQREADQRRLAEIEAQFHARELAQGQAILKQIHDENTAVEQGFKRQMAAAAQYYTRLADESEKEAKRQEQVEQKEAQIALAVGGAWASAFESIASGSESSSKAVIDASISSAQTAINAAAASAAAEAAFSQAGIPILGPALAIAASGIIFGLVKGFLSKVTAFAAGGLVMGGTPGRDSVPAILTPGERVLTVEQNRAYERGGAGGPSVVVHMAPQWRGVTPPNQTDGMAFLKKDFARLLYELCKNGHIKIHPNGVRE